MVFLKGKINITENPLVTTPFVTGSQSSAVISSDMALPAISERLVWFGCGQNLTIRNGGHVPTGITCGFVGFHIFS